MTKRFKAAVIGGSGYGGGELIRRLLLHPEVELARVASIDLVLGYMPSYGIAVTAIDGAGRRHEIDGRFQGVPGVVPHPRLAFASPVEDVREIHVTIDDSRPKPIEGYHIHVYEVVVR